MGRFEFESNGVQYIIYAETDCDDGGQFVTFDISRDDDKNMTMGEELKVRRDFNHWYHNEFRK